MCAVSYDDVCAAAKTLGNPELQVVNLHPTRLADVWTDLRKVGDALGLDAGAVLAGLHARVAAVGARRRVLTIEWLEPVMVGGTWMPELVELAGCTPLVTSPGQHAPTLSDEELAALDPEVVVFKPCGFDVDRTRTELARVHEICRKFPAATAYVADGDAYFNRPGPRIVDSLEILASAIHPDVFGKDPRLVAV